MTPRQPSDGLGPRPATGRGLREVAGVLMVVAGSLVLLGLVYIGNDPSPASERLMFHLGLALTGLISACAQGLVFGGLAVLWAALKRR
jgi:hypothetical protein